MCVRAACGRIKATDIACAGGVERRRLIPCPPALSGSHGEHPVLLPLTSSSRVCSCGLRAHAAPEPLYSMDLRISVVMTRQLALGLMTTSPVMRPTSEKIS